MYSLKYKIMTTVLLIALLLIGLLVYLSGLNTNKDNVDTVAGPVVEQYDANSYYTEYYMNVDDVKFSKDLLSDNVECSLSYSLNVNSKESSDSLYDGLCSNMSENDLIIDDKHKWGKVNEKETVVDKAMSGNDTVYMFLSIVDDGKVNEYVVEVPVMSLRYSVIDNILRFEKDVEITVNSYDDVVLKIDGRGYSFV